MRISDWSSDVCSSDLTVLRQALEHRVGRGALGHQHCVGAHGQRKSQPIAQTVSEEQLGRRKHDIAFFYAQHGLAVEFGRVPQISMRMDNALGLSGGSR